MDTLTDRQKKALALVEKIVELDPDTTTTAYALKMEARLRLPMTAVLEKLWPEETVTYKVRRLGITRQAYYGWLAGEYRPDDKLAKELAKHTGFDWEHIRGKLPPQR
jgi:hypothetical protein